MIDPVRDVILHEERPDLLQQLDGNHDVGPRRAVRRNLDRSSGRCIGHCVPLSRYGLLREFYRADGTSRRPKCSDSLPLTGEVERTQINFEHERQI